MFTLVIFASLLAPPALLAPLASPCLHALCALKKLFCRACPAGPASPGLLAAPTGAARRGRINRVYYALPRGTFFRSSGPGTARQHLAPLSLYAARNRPLSLRVTPQLGHPYPPAARIAPPYRARAARTRASLTAPRATACATSLLLYRTKRSRDMRCRCPPRLYRPRAARTSSFSLLRYPYHPPRTPAASRSARFPYCTAPARRPTPPDAPSYRTLSAA
ncbi:hypothetical protein B0H17DRAFT_1194105 [Mycena rosella]|uniref:Uncharacterized protein n=1 Tax=Mycena rosella TaxID=1033263 RepID=A0AAD7E252_MYCRO|nr:hypothetical protein B0H17DRAFT_1194105 [Mycena rosella]